MTIDYYEKTIRRAMKANGSYDKSYELLICKAAQYLSLVDSCYESLSELGVVVEVTTREGNIVPKANPASKSSTEYGRIAVSMLSELGLSPKSLIGATADDPAVSLVNKINSITDDE